MHNISYLYIAPTLCGKYFKIGKSRNVISRLKKISNNIKFDLNKILYYRVSSDYVSHLEKILHRCFLKDNIVFPNTFDGSTEFFNIKKIDSVQKIINEISNDISGPIKLNKDEIFIMKICNGNSFLRNINKKSIFKNRNYLKLNNSLIDNNIKEGNIYTYKLLYYLTKEGLNIKNIVYLNDLVEFEINIEDLILNLKTSKSIFKNNINNIYKTKTSILNLEVKKKYVNIFSIITFISNFCKIRMNKSIFNLIQNGNLNFDPKKGNYTIIKNLDKMMNLKNLHSIRMFVALNRIRDYGDGAKQQLYLTSEEVNKYFGVNYNSHSDIRRYLLKPIEKDISKIIPFRFEPKYDMESKSKGRKPVIGYTFFYESKIEIQDCLSKSEFEPEEIEIFDDSKICSGEDFIEKITSNPSIILKDSMKNLRLSNESPDE